MMTTTWELHFAAPRSSEQAVRVQWDLGVIKQQYTVMCVDWFEDGEVLSVMVDSAEVLKRVLRDLYDLQLLKLTCQFSTDGGSLSGTLVLDDEEDENSEICFPTDEGSE